MRGWDGDGGGGWRYCVAVLNDGTVSPPTVVMEGGSMPHERQGDKLL